MRVSPWRVSVSLPQEWDAFKHSVLNNLMILICRHADRTDQKLMLITVTKNTSSNLISPLNGNKNNIPTIKSTSYFLMGFTESGFSSVRSPMSHPSGATRLQRSKRKSKWLFFLFLFLLCLNLMSSAERNLASNLSSLLQKKYTPSDSDPTVRL